MTWIVNATNPCPSVGQRLQAQQQHAAQWEARGCLNALCCGGVAAGRVALLAALHHSPRFVPAGTTSSGTPTWCLRCAAVSTGRNERPCQSPSQAGACAVTCILQSSVCQWSADEPLTRVTPMRRHLPQSWAAERGGLGVATEGDYQSAAAREAADAWAAQQPAGCLGQDDSGCTQSAAMCPRDAGPGQASMLAAVQPTWKRLHSIASQVFEGKLHMWQAD